MAGAAAGGPEMTDSDQARFWDKEAGPKWVREARAMDALLAPVLEALLARAAPREGEQVLDVGCGSGASSLALAVRVGPGGHVLGADISAPLLAAARARAEAAGLSQLEFRQCDAETEAFAPAATDLIFSRFGVMFFEDPAAAFANMARALRPGGRLWIAAWGEIAENPSFTLPAAVAREVFGGAPPRGDPDGPGPFAFREVARIRAILEAAGLSEVAVEAAPLALPAPASTEALADLMCEIGPVAGAFTHFEASPRQRAATRDGIVTALRPYERAGRVLLPAQINFATGRVD